MQFWNTLYRRMNRNGVLFSACGILALQFPSLESITHNGAWKKNIDLELIVHLWTQKKVE